MKSLLFKSSFTNRKLKTRKYFVSLCRDEKTLFYYVFVDSKYNHEVESIERVKCSTFSEAFEYFHYSIVRYSGICIKYFGDELPI